jgi:hypothetical protein
MIHLPRGKKGKLIELEWYYGKNNRNERTR